MGLNDYKKIKEMYPLQDFEENEIDCMSEKELLGDIKGLISKKYKCDLIEDDSVLQFRFSSGKVFYLKIHQIKYK